MSKKALLFSGAPVAATTTLDPANTSANISLSGGNLVATDAVSTANGDLARSVASHSSGKYYCEHIFTGSGVTYSKGIGLVNSSEGLTNVAPFGTDLNSVAYWHTDPNIYVHNASFNTGVQMFNGNIYATAIDIDNLTFWVRINGGNWNNNVANDPASNTGGISFSAISGPFYFVVYVQPLGAVVTINFGATSYAGTPPSGFGNW